VQFRTLKRNKKENKQKNMRRMIKERGKGNCGGKAE
jgi:hypothetical protein